MFQNGLMNGFGKIFYANGAFFVGMFKNGIYNGQGKLVKKDGRLKEG